MCWTEQSSHCPLLLRALGGHERLPTDPPLTFSSSPVTFQMPVLEETSNSRQVEHLRQRVAWAEEMANESRTSGETLRAIVLAFTDTP